jgi:hypothetical protein
MTDETNDGKSTRFGFFGTKMKIAAISIATVLIAYIGWARTSHQNNPSSVKAKVEQTSPVDDLLVRSYANLATLTSYQIFFQDQTGQRMVNSFTINVLPDGSWYGLISEKGVEYGANVAYRDGHLYIEGDGNFEYDGPTFYSLSRIQADAIPNGAWLDGSSIHGTSETTTFLNAVSPFIHPSGLADALPPPPIRVGATLGTRNEIPHVYGPGGGMDIVTIAGKTYPNNIYDKTSLFHFSNYNAAEPFPSIDQIVTWSQLTQGSPPTP